MESVKPSYSLKHLFFTVIFLEILTGAEVDLFVPSFPELQDVFSLTPFLVELTISLNLGAHCIASLLVGNLGDRYGRRPVIIYSLLIFVLGSVLTVLAPAYWVLLLGRILQGVGASGPGVLSIIIVADLFPHQEAQRKMAVINGAVTLAMAFAPILGSYVTRIFHWQGNFFLLLIMGLSSLIVAWRYLPVGVASRTISLSLSEYLPVLHSKKALYYIFGLGFLLQGYWVFISLSPILYVDDLGVSLEMFGIYQGATAAAFSVFSLGSGYFLKRFGEKTCLAGGTLLLIAFFVGAVGLMIFDVRNPLFITCIFMLAAIGLVFPLTIMWSRALESVPLAKGRISALAVAVRLIITSIAVQGASYFYDHRFLSIGVTICINLVLACYCGYRVFMLERKIITPNKPQELEWHL